MYIAGTFRRASAHIFDEIIGSIFWLPLIVSVWKHSKDGPDVLIAWKWIGITWVARMLYEVLCIYILQALPVQYFLGLRIVSTYNSEMGLNLMQIFIRVLISQLKYILGPSIYLMALFHKERQHLGDIIAETQVKQFAERAFKPKCHFILGSLLVYLSLLSHLSNNVELISKGKIQKEGVLFSLPSIKTLQLPNSHAFFSNTNLFP